MYDFLCTGASSFRGLKGKEDVMKATAVVTLLVACAALLSVAMGRVAVSDAGTIGRYQLVPDSDR